MTPARRTRHRTLGAALARALQRALMAALLLCLGAPLAAQQSLPPAPYADRQLDDPVQEAAAQELMASLRCLECQSQAIDDSNSPMAGDMRHQVRIRIAAGEDPEAIRGWLMERYGDYVSYTPQVSATTWPLFAVPLLILLVAGAIFWRRFGKRA
ncbi:MAG: cytochrome c-type biogenesis protein CcmH [Alphaproteobacteria bacterium]|nr:cytochrome c-type biogenesis protein CcmH [Alphaproteobacteria bacterium]